MRYNFKMFIRKKNGEVIQATSSEITGEKREDGRFHVKLKDGTEGIQMSKAEVDKEKENNAEAVRELITFLETGEPQKRDGMQMLYDEYNKD